MPNNSVMDDAKEYAVRDKENTPSIFRVYCCSDENDDEVKLLEVSGDGPSWKSKVSTSLDGYLENGIEHHKSTAILVNENAFNDIKNGKVPLPEGWLDISKDKKL